jgi:hypothetical protein
MAAARSSPDKGFRDTSPDKGFRGNKQSLPSKPCVACGRPMSWRKRWARTWDEVKFCSDACRKARAGGAAP